MKSNIATGIAATVVAMLLISAVGYNGKGNAEVGQIDNVYVFVNSKPTMPYDTVFKFSFSVLTYQQAHPVDKYLKNAVKAAYKKNDGKAFDGILFGSDGGYHYAIKFK